MSVVTPKILPPPPHTAQDPHMFDPPTTFRCHYCRRKKNIKDQRFVDIPADATKQTVKLFRLTCDQCARKQWTQL